MTKKWILLAPLAILAFILFIALGGEVVKLLWNWLLPPLFGWSQITYWQGLGILALSRILFGGFGFHGPRSNIRHRMWRHKDTGMREWLDMTPEERERFRQGIKTPDAQA